MPKRRLFNISPLTSGRGAGRGGPGGIGADSGAPSGGPGSGRGHHGGDTQGANAAASRGATTGAQARGAGLAGPGSFGGNPATQGGGVGSRGGPSGKQKATSIGIALSGIKSAVRGSPIGAGLRGFGNLANTVASEVDDAFDAQAAKFGFALGRVNRAAAKRGFGFKSAVNQRTKAQTISPSQVARSAVDTSNAFSIGAIAAQRGLSEDAAVAAAQARGVRSGVSALGRGFASREARARFQDSRAPADTRFIRSTRLGASASRARARFSDSTGLTQYGAQQVNRRQSLAQAKNILNVSPELSFNIPAERELSAPRIAPVRPGQAVSGSAAVYSRRQAQESAKINRGISAAANIRATAPRTFRQLTGVKTGGLTEADQARVLGYAHSTGAQDYNEIVRTGAADIAGFGTFNPRLARPKNPNVRSAIGAKQVVDIGAGVLGGVAAIKTAGAAAAHSRIAKARTTDGKIPIKDIIKTSRQRTSTSSGTRAAPVTGTYQQFQRGQASAHRREATLARAETTRLAATGGARVLGSARSIISGAGRILRGSPRVGTGTTSTAPGRAAFSIRIPGRAANRIPIAEGQQRLVLGAGGAATVGGASISPAQANIGIPGGGVARTSPRIRTTATTVSPPTVTAPITGVPRSPGAPLRFGGGGTSPNTVSFADKLPTISAEEEEDLRKRRLTFSSPTRSSILRPRQVRRTSGRFLTYRRGV